MPPASLFCLNIVPIVGVPTAVVKAIDMLLPTVGTVKKRVEWTAG